MKLSWPTRVLVAGAMFTTGAYLYWSWDFRRKRLVEVERRKSIRRKREAASNLEKSDQLACLLPYLQRNAPLSSQVRDGLTYASRFVASDEKIGLSQRTQARVFSSASRIAAAGEAEDLDKATRSILKEVMSDCPWNSITMPPTPGSDWEAAYTGVLELLQLAALEMRYVDYHKVHGRSDVVGAGIVCPGWNNMAPAPTQGIGPGDLIEVMLGAEDEEGLPVYTETAYAEVDRVDGDNIFAKLIGEDGELSPGTPTPSIRGTEHHGYQMGSEIRINRRCIYSVRPMEHG